MHWIQGMQLHCAQACKCMLRNLFYLQEHSSWITFQQLHSWVKPCAHRLPCHLILVNTRIDPNASADEHTGKLNEASCGKVAIESMHGFKCLLNATWAACKELPSASGNHVSAYMKQSAITDMQSSLRSTRQALPVSCRKHMRENHS